jgi:hypothetical protein
LVIPSASLAGELSEANDDVTSFVIAIGAT